MPRTIAKDSPISEGVNRRFFEAIETLVNLGRISALESFCTLHDLSAPRYREMRLNFGVSPKADYVSRYKNIEIEAIYSLVANYPISSRWLITGRGKMLSGKI